jgi:hypothetical protein
MDVQDEFMNATWKNKNYAYAFREALHFCRYTDGE